MEDKVNKSQLRINQHYVPKLYLKEWCIPGTEQIHVYDKTSNNQWHTNIMNVASERFFYDIDLKDYFSDSQIQILNEKGLAIGEKSQIIEEHASHELEVPMSIMLKSLIYKSVEASPWTVRNCFFILPEEKELLSVFLSFQLIRTKAVRNEILDSADRLTQILADMGVPEEKIAEYILTSKQAKKIHNRMLLNHEGILKTASLFNRLTWILGINRTEKSFYTTDNPIGKQGHIKPKPAFLSGTGLATPGVEVFYPLTPELILVMIDGEIHKHMAHKERRYAEIETEQTIDYYNSIVAKQANRFVFSNSGDYSLLNRLRAKDPDVLNQPRSYSEWGRKRYYARKIQSKEK